MADELRTPGIKVLYVESIRSLSSLLQHRARYFTLLIAWDASALEVSELERLFRLFIDKKLAYLCAWGENCDQLHDAVDSAYVMAELEGGPLDWLTMTTSHRDESLEEATWFFSRLAIPSEPHVFADFERFAVAVGNPEWKSIIERTLVAEQ